MSSIVNEFGQPFTFAHAADRSTRRGPQFAVRNDDIDRLIPAMDRKALASLSNRLFWNKGVLRACILQKADYSIGEAWLPSYLGQDADIGKTAAAFMREIWMTNCTTQGGQFDWWKLLELTSIAEDRDGDNFWMMVKDKDGFPRIQVIGAHRCGNSYGMTETVSDGVYKGYRIRDGVIYYRSGRPAAYRFNLGVDGKDDFKDIPASDVIHNFDPVHCEQGRGLPAFTCGLEGLKMSLLSTEDERIRQQIVSRMHLTIFNETGGPDLDDPMTTLTANKEGTGFLTTQNIPGGVTYQAEGSRVEQMTHTNPGEIWESFQDRLIKDAIISNWSYSVWKGSGQGTDARAEVVKCRRFVTKRQGQLWYAAKRAFAWAYSVFAEQGRFAPVKNPTAWDFSRPPRLSVDDGRESKMELEELRAGSRNLSEVWEARGITEDEFEDARARSVWMRKFKAVSVAEELNKKHGVQIKIEEREMFMLTPNEMGDQSQPDTPNADPNNPEQSRDDQAQ